MTSKDRHIERLVGGIRRSFVRLLSFFRSGRAEGDLAREITAHLQLLEDKFIAQGMSAADARYAARRAFGGVEQVKEHQRDTRSFRWLDGWWLDVKLGIRLLIKYPGLTLVGGLAIAFAIATGTAAFEFLTQYTHPTLPLDDGDRVVGIRLWHTASSSVEEQTSYDFVRWREEVESIEDIGAFRTLDRNLTTEDGRAEPVQVAEISASAFHVARVLPAKGRFLVAADEQPAAPAVVVIGHDVWQSRFGGEPGVVGRTVRLGSAQSTVVGVMPQGFAFPVSHSVWTPLRVNALNYGRRQGPQIHVFGRLAPSVTFEQAQAEFTGLGRRAAADYPDMHEHLRPQVVAYAQLFRETDAGLMYGIKYAINLFFGMLLGLVCANVALLMFARAATRESEIAVRNALGASRGRIITQLFAEALVLVGVATAAGLAAAGFALRWWLSVSKAEAGGRLPFWFNDNIAPTTVFYAIVLTLLGAAIVGVVPALKVTGRGLESRLRQATAGGGGLRFGGLWTVVIVTQVAVTVAFPATAFFVRRSVVQIQSLDVGFPAADYLSARLEMDRETPPGTSGEAHRAEGLARFRATCQELERRLEAEPGVAGVTFTSVLPRTLHAQRWIELDGEAASAGPGPRLRVGSASVALDYFDVLGTEVLSGRGFHHGDLDNSAASPDPSTPSGSPRASSRGERAPASRGVLVNESFVRQFLAGRNAIGRRVRYLPRENPTRSPDQQRGPWYEIVGVVRDLGMIADSSQRAGLYHALAGAASPIHIAVHVKGDPEAFAPRLRSVAAALDPTLQLHELMPLNKVGATLWMEFDFLFRLLVLVSSIAMLLSLAGIYSVMSFTVSRRTREIGIRVALGADPPRVVTATFSRPLAQVAVGVLAGGGLVFVLTQLVTGLSAKEFAIVVAYMMLMMLVCMLACIVPTRRALRVAPTEALKADG